jgi:Beta-ketoacyl synthase, N-terminal domain
MNAVAFGVSAWAWSDASADIRCAGQVSADHAESRILDLPAAERRRLNPLTTSALRVAERLVAGRERAELQDAPLVFGSADGDGAVLMKLLGALRAHEPVSPTQFHNSVHNSPAGYWTIGLASQAASTAIACDDETLEVTLLEAGLQAVVRGGPVVILYASRSFPPELQHVRPDLQNFALACWCEPTIHPHGWRCELNAPSSGSVIGGLSLDASIRRSGEGGLSWRRHVSHLGGILALERV